MSNDRAQEISNHLHISLPLLMKWHVRAVRKLDPFDFWDSCEEGRNANVLRFVECSIDQKSRTLDCVQNINDGPCFERTNNCELGWTVPAN